MDLAAIQQELQARRLDGWLFYDHHHRDAVAYRILGLPEDLFVTRRWYYLIPAHGEARKLVHRIEAGALDGLPGRRAEYAQWGELGQALREMLAAAGRRIAMQYSPGNALPAVGLVDAGTVEQVRALGVEVASSCDLISRFDAVWSPAMLASHRRAGHIVQEAIREGFAHVGHQLNAGRPISEYGLQQWLVERMRGAGMTLDGEAPIVAVNEHAGDPHYQPGAGGSAQIAKGDLLLLDVFGRMDEPGSAYYDVTWMGYCMREGESAVPRRFVEVFDLARRARDAGIALVTGAVAEGRLLRGYEVDRAVRGVIAAAGLGAYFVHRTGHSLGRDVHATGANMDDHETHDEREILLHSGFTIEPGIYRPGGEPLGVRTEVNLYIGTDGAQVTGPRQTEIVTI